MLKHICCWFILGCLIANTLQAQVGDFSREEITKKIKIQRLVMSYISLKQFSGVVTVTIDGKKDPLYQYTTGFANLDYHVPNSLTALYNLCELSQSLTATAIMQLVEKEKLDVQAPIGDYLPDIAAKIGQPITIHQLLTHTAGLPNYYESENYMNNFLDISKIEDLITLILEQPLDFAPGSRVKPSPSNYVVLAALLEKVSGLNYMDYIKANIFKRAEMPNAELYSWRDIIDNRGVGYTFDEDGAPILPATFWGAYPFGADAIYSDSHSLLAFADAFYKNKLVSAETKAQMIKNYVYFDGADKTDGFSYGWRTKEFFGKKVVYNGGELQGLSVQLRRYVEDGYTVVVLSNYHNNKALEIATDIEHALCNPSYVAPGHPVSLLVQKAIQKDGVEKTLTNIETLLAESPVPLDKVWALNSLGKSYLETGQAETAAALFEVNAKKFPDDPEVYGSLGDAHLQLKNYDKAIASFEQRIALSPNDKWAKGMLKRVQTEKEKAKNNPVVEAIPTTEQETTTEKEPLKEKSLATEDSQTTITTVPPNTKELTIEFNLTPPSESQPSDENPTKIITQEGEITSVPKNVTPTLSEQLSNLDSNLPTAQPEENTTTPTQPTTTNQDEHATPTPEITFEPEFYTDAATPSLGINNPINANPINTTTQPAINELPPANTSSAITNEEKNIVMDAAAESHIYVLVDDMPQFPGGEQALGEYWKANLRYPVSAKENGVEGKVKVSFIVETNGALKNIRIHKGMIGGGNGCNNEALRLVRSMPKWTPGQQQGAPARVFYTLAVPFNISE